MSTLFEQIGGENAVNAAVDIFYSKVLQDHSIKKFFTNVDMPTQIKKQKSFLTFAFGGPNKYSGKGMANAHRHLISQGLNDQHVDVVIELLASTLNDLKVPEPLIMEVAKIAESVRDQVLGRAN